MVTEMEQRFVLPFISFVYIALQEARVSWPAWSSQETDITKRDYMGQEETLLKQCHPILTKIGNIQYGKGTLCGN
jgi:hypothetical protein